MICVCLLFLIPITTSSQFHSFHGSPRFINGMETMSTKRTLLITSGTSIRTRESVNGGGLLGCVYPWHQLIKHWRNGEGRQCVDDDDERKELKAPFSPSSLNQVRIWRHPSFVVCAFVLHEGAPRSSSSSRPHITGWLSWQLCHVCRVKKKFAVNSFGCSFNHGRKWIFYLIRVLILGEIV